MNTTGERLRYVIESQYNSVKEFCTKFDINYPGLTSILNDKRPLGMEVYVKIKQAIPEMDSEYILFGNQRQVTNIENNDETLKLNEPSTLYRPDPFESVLLRYLEGANAQKIITDSVKKIIMNLGGDEHNIELGEKNSTMFADMEELLKKEMSRKKDK